MPIALPPLNGTLNVPTRDQSRNLWLRDYQLRNPGARIDPGTEPYLKASTYADSAVPIYVNAQLIAANTSRQTMVGPALVDEARSMGTDRLPAVGASGAVSVTTASGGATIFVGDLLTIGTTIYQCMQTGAYSSTNNVPIQGVTTGPGTNQNAGTIGQWQTPRPGCAASATVVAQADGSGLSNGHDAESDDELRNRLNFLAANPPASGNDAEIQLLATQCPGLSVESAFTYPCILGPGSTSVAFTLRANSAGGNRIPNATQVALMSAWLQAPGNLPADVSLTVAALIPQQVSVALKTMWMTGVGSWADSPTWPAWTAVLSEPQIATPTTGTASPTYFRVINAAVAPLPGQTIAVFDLANLTFRRKRILSVAVDGGGAGGYDLTIDTSQGISDTTYTPYAGQFVCPWADNIQTVTLPLVQYLGALGPGEMEASFLDPGSRQKRSPTSPAQWPSVFSQRIYAGPQTQPFTPYGQQPAAPSPTLSTLSSLLDVGVLEPSLPLATTVGSPGVTAYLLVLGDLACYP